MHWLLQNNLYSEEGFDTLINVLTRLNLPYSIHNVVPFEGSLSPSPEPQSDKVIVMGSYTLATYAASKGWVPGSYLDNLDFQIQHSYWKEHMLNHDAVIVKFSEVPEQSKPFFIRPVLDTKSFSGEVMDWPSFEEWRKRVLGLDYATVTADTLVMVCSKKILFNETRVWVVNGKVITASGYKVGTIKRYSEPNEVEPYILQFVKEMIDIWVPNQAFVIDVALTTDGLKIIEVNNLNSAGFYKGDMFKLIQSLEELNAK